MAPRWPPFTETCDEIEGELQAHGTRLLEMVCDTHTYDAATRARLLSNLPAWTTDMESLKHIYTRTIELRALKYPKRDQEAFIESHRPIDRIPCIQVHVQRVKPDDVRRETEYVHAEVFHELAPTRSDLQHCVRIPLPEIQQRETFGCLELNVCLYNDSVAHSGIDCSGAVQTPLLPNCEAAVAQWETLSHRARTQTYYAEHYVWQNFLSKWVPPVLADNFEFVLRVAKAHSIYMLDVASPRLQNDVAFVARLIRERFDLSDRTIDLWTKNVRLARLALGTHWKVKAWRKIDPQLWSELEDDCPIEFASIGALRKNNEWMFASPELVATDEFAIACFLGNLSNLYDHSPELFVKAAKMPPPANELSCATAHDQQDRDHSEDYWFWWRMYAWVEHGNDAVLAHAGAMAELARHLATAELAPSAYMFRPKRLGAAMGAVPGLQRADVIDAMLRRVETTGAAKTVVDLALAFLDATAKTDRVDRFTEAHVDRLGAIAARLKSTKADSARAALVGRIIAAVENPARAVVQKRVRNELEAFEDHAVKMLHT